MRCLPVAVLAMTACGTTDAVEGTGGTERCREAAEWTATRPRSDLDAALRSCQAALGERRVEREAGAAYLQLGVGLQNAGNFEGSLAPLREAVTLPPRQAEAHYRLGRSLATVARASDLGRSDPRTPMSEEARGMFREAQRNYRTAVGMDARMSAAWTGLAWVSWELGDEGESIEAYERAAATDPASVEKALELGKVLNRARRFEQSVRVLEHVALREPGAFAAGGVHHDILAASRGGQRWAGWDSDTD